MGDNMVYVPEIILSFTTPSDDNTEGAMRRTIVSADDWIDSVEFHRSGRVYLDDCIAFTATVRLKIEPCTLRSAIPQIVELVAREICQELAKVFPTEQYWVSWSLRFTGARASSVYKAAFA